MLKEVSSSTEEERYVRITEAASVIRNWIIGEFQDNDLQTIKEKMLQDMPDVDRSKAIFLGYDPLLKGEVVIEPIPLARVPQYTAREINPLDGLADAA
jgi:hypothetical protein